MEILPVDISTKTTVIERDDDAYPEVGSWYWIPPQEVPPGRIIRNNEAWLGCVMEQGSNYVLIVEPGSRDHSSRNIRVHVNEFHTIRHEPGATEYFKLKIETCRETINSTLQEIKDVTARLGIVDRESLPQHVDQIPQR